MINVGSIAEGLERNAYRSQFEVTIITGIFGRYRRYKRSSSQRSSRGKSSYTFSSSPRKNDQFNLFSDESDADDVIYNKPKRGARQSTGFTERMGQAFGESRNQSKQLLASIVRYSCIASSIIAVNSDICL